jgi:arylsulfatase A-like enzyme
LVSGNRTSFAFLAALLILVLAYRVRLTWGLFTHPIKPFDFSPSSHPLGFALAFGDSDLVLILTCFFLFGLLGQGRFFLKSRSIFLLFQIAGLALLNLILGCLLFLHLGHFRFLFDAQTGFDFGVILESVYSVSTVDTLKFLEVRDWLFVGFPLAVFWAVWLIPPVPRAWIVKGSLAAMGLWGVFSLWVFPGEKNPVPAELRANPGIFFVSDLAEHLRRSPERERMLTRVEETEPGLKLTGPLYSHPVRAVKNLPPPAQHPWNVVFLVLESLGTRYMLGGGSEKGPAPMPFLNRLAKQGWFLQNHYAPSNVSTKAMFSVLSGLYDFFNRGTLGVRPDAQIPSLPAFLGETYDSFLVSPSSSAWYFPLPFLKNGGLGEIHTYETLNFKIREELSTLGRYIARDEIQTVDFFLRRITKAREPFLGMYVSFVAHFPYFDYGPDYRLVEMDGKSLSRYINNLYLLDRMVERIFDHLRNLGLLARTILVIVGDHGQAFGQHHPDNYLHYRYSYNVNLEAPVIFYQPALFQPRSVRFPTNHTDILPTLLDALRIPYNSALLDGESLFQRKLKRKYLFFYGHEESISSLSTEGIKVQVSLKKNRCWAFDLKTDPGEMHYLDCAPYQAQVEALRNFARHHDAGLARYNASNREGKDFQGQRHPALAAPPGGREEKKRKG